MPWRTFLKLTRKAFRFAVSRPIQRYNIENRAKTYLGPDAKNFKPAPRISAPLPEGCKPLLAARDEKLISDASRLDVKKHVVLQEKNCDIDLKSDRPLPKLTNLPLQDPAAIWLVGKVPPGRLDVNMLQELMLNKLADDEYWTPNVIANKYNIKEGYAESLVKYLKQIRIVVSPKMAKALDTVGLKDPNYQAAKHIVYHVDNSLRTESDRKFDEMYLPDEQLDPEVSNVLEPFAKKLIESSSVRRNNIVKRPEPLRISALNQKANNQSSQVLEESTKLKIDSPKSSVT